MEIDAWVPVVGVLVVAAITPGPNNFMVMEASARGGVAAAAGVVLGVVLGSLSLLALIFLGVGSAIHAHPALGLVLNIAGGAYLAWLGASLIFRGAAPSSRDTLRGMPQSLWGVAVFQLLNPKAWVLIMTAVAAVTEAGSVLGLAVLVALVSSICLSIWAFAGAASAQLLAGAQARYWFERTMGALLALSALGIIVDAIA
jgi:threonine/homoserine/homoserine lactone efflux protein